MTYRGKDTAYKENIPFRFPIGSCDTETLKFWEPNAPSFEERFSSLKLAYHKGFNTSVSSKPILDTNIFQLVETLLPFVTDAIWIGKPNQLLARLRMNGITDSESIIKAKELMAAFPMNGFVNFLMSIRTILKSNGKKVLRRS